jgi:hypothetical protein
MRTLLLAALLALSGCATFSEQLELTFPDGTIVSYRVQSSVLGTGETEFSSGADGSTAYSTKDTGLSDNGLAALGVIAEGAVNGLIPVDGFGGGFNELTTYTYGITP